MMKMAMNWMMDLAVALTVNLALLISLAFLAIGCGGAAHKQTDDVQEVAAAQKAALTSDVTGIPTRVGSELRLKILPGQADHPELPDFAADPVVTTEPFANETGTYSPTRDKQVIISGNQISFQEVIPLFQGKKERSLFLVWDENALGTRIINAYHTHQEEGPMHDKTYTVRQVPANFDSEQKFFFVPLLEAIDEDADDVDSNEIHTVTLAFTFDTRTRVEVNIHLRLLGTMPKFEPKAEVPTDALNLPPEQFSHEVSDGKITIRRLSVQNPAHRPFLIWLKGESDFRLETIFTRPHYSANPQQPPTASPQNASARGDLDVKEVWVHRIQEATAEKLTLTPGQWTSLSFRAGESIELDWMLSRSAQAQDCFIPPADQRSLGWATPHFEIVESETAGSREGGGPIEHEVQTGWDQHSASVTESWSYLGARIRGQGRFEVLLTDPFIRVDELSGVLSAKADLNTQLRLPIERIIDLDPEGSAPSMADAPFLLSTGPDRPSLDMDFPCQGVFPSSS